MVNISFGPGRPPANIEGEIVREIGEGDLARLAVPRGIQPPVLKRLTQMHHAIARLVAQGEAGYSIAMATGYSESRISILKSDPAFQELVAHYTTDAEAVRDQAWVNTQAKLSAFHNDIVDTMHDRLHDTPELVTNRDLSDWAKFAADRSGFGPSTKSQNVNVNFDIAEEIAVGQRRALELAASVPSARAEKRGTLEDDHDQPGDLPPRPVL